MSLRRLFVVSILFPGIAWCQGSLFPAVLPPTRTGLLYVSGTASHTIGEFQPDGTLVRTIAPAGLLNPRGIGIDATGNLMVVSQTNAAVRRIARDGTVLSVFTFPELVSGTGIAHVGSGIWYVGNFSPGRVLIFDENSPGSPAQVLTQPGMEGVNCVAFDAGGAFAVSAAMTNQIHRFGAAGNWLGAVTHPTLSSPMSIAVDSQGAHYVSNGGTNLVSKFDAAWNFVLSFGAGILSGPQGIAIDEFDRLTVTNFNVAVIARFDTQGNLIDGRPLAGIQLGRNLAHQNAPYAMARDGGVNLRADALFRPLLLNGVTGDALGQMTLPATTALTVSMASPPGGAGGAPFVLYANAGAASVGDVENLPLGLGFLAFRPPFSASPATSFALVNSLGFESLLGTGVLPATLAPGTVFALPGGAGFLGTVVLQAVILDPMARNPGSIPLSPTNAITATFF